MYKQKNIKNSINELNECFDSIKLISLREEALKLFDKKFKKENPKDKKFKNEELKTILLYKYDKYLHIRNLISTGNENQIKLIINDLNKMFDNKSKKQINISNKNKLRKVA